MIATANAAAVTAPLPFTSARPRANTASTSCSAIGRSHTGNHASPIFFPHSPALSGAALATTKGNAPDDFLPDPSRRDALPRNRPKASHAKSMAHGVSCPSRKGLVVPLLKTLFAALNQHAALKSLRQ